MVNQSRVAAAQARGEFGKPEEREHLTLETVTGKLLKRQ
jgi:hypothetical protein